MHIFTFDLETHLFSPGNMAPRPVCLTTTNSLFVGPDMTDVLEGALRSDATIIGHNVQFDFAVVLAHWPHLAQSVWAAYAAGRVQCTKIRAMLLDIAEHGHVKPKGYSLQALAKKYLDVDLDKDTWRTGYADLEGVPLDQWPQGAIDYAINDAKYTEDLYNLQAEATKNYPGFQEEATRQATYGFALHLMSVWGVHTDGKLVKELKNSLQNSITEAEVAMQTAGLIRPDGTKDMQTIRALVEKSYPDKVPRTPKGQIKTGADVLENCNHPALKAMVEHNAASKILSTYVLHYEAGVTAPIHSRYSLVGSGRTSCSNPNWQNQPRLPGIRECIIPRPGRLLVACDYDSQELRTLAQAALDIVGWSKLAQRYQQNPDFDPHTALASQLMKISEARALELKTQGDKTLKKYRQHSKAANFGFPGGMGAKGFVGYADAMGIALTIREAEGLRNTWLATWPEMERYLAWITMQTNSGSARLTLPRSKRRRGACGFCDGSNYYFQGLAADASKTAAFMVARKCYNDPASPLWGCRPIIFIHDEIIMEAPADRAPEAAEELAKVMMEAMQIWTPDIPARASPALMHRWHKEAETVRDQTGRLIPWTPPAATK